MTLFYRIMSGLIMVSSITLALTFCVSTALMAEELEAYLWQKRPLLIFAEEIDNPQLKQLKHQLVQRQRDIEDREIVVGVFVKNGVSTFDNKRTSSSYATLLRNRYQTGNQTFAVILVGKDGGEKYRLYEAPELDEIFALIDGMPMRQVEMMESSSNCGQT